MQIRIGLCVLACCAALAALAACTAGPNQGPNTAVTTPHVGRPQPPSSAQAALSRDAFTPYAALGLSDNDGLAPSESIFALGNACMSAAGYPGANAGDVPVGISIGGPTALAFSQPWGAWGYLGAAAAQQYGFLASPGSALATLGVDFQPNAFTSLPQAEQTAGGKCSTIVQNFTDGAESRALAGIRALANDIFNDVQHDPAVRAAGHAWSACMSKSGYRFDQPSDVFRQELQNIYNGGKRGPLDITPGAAVSNSARQAQLATAVTDSDCSLSTDLAGIYFAVLASYEQQLVNANQQALSAAVRQYRTTYTREL
ncbi:MAG TPA: hypothetical protein VGI31_09665, partial [Streptosporangiaceae bacterium]